MGIEMGYDDPKDNPTLAQQFNPINWRPLVWGWLMMLVVACVGIAWIVHRASVEPEQPSAADRQRSVEATQQQLASPEERSSRPATRTNPAVLENSSSDDNQRASGTNQGNHTRSDGGGGDAAFAGSGENKRASGTPPQFPKVFNGKHTNRTTPFESPGQMTIKWTVTGPLFQLLIKREDGGTVKSAVSRSGLSGTTSGQTTVSAEGTIYFKVNAVGDWKLRVDA